MREFTNLELSQQATEMDQATANQAAFDEQQALNAERDEESHIASETLARNFEVWIDDSRDNAADLDVDVATAVLREAGVPVVGLAHKTSFDGCYWVNVPQTWYDELEESGDDFDATTRGYLIHAAMV